MDTKRKYSKTKIHMAIIIGLFLLVTILETYGFATYSQLVQLNGVVTYMPDGVMEISSVNNVDSSNVSEITPVSWNDLDIGFDILYQVTDVAYDYFIKYKITMNNDSSYDYTFTNQNFNSELLINGAPPTDGTYLDIELDGISFGDVIPAKSNKEFYVSFVLYPQTPDTDYGASGSFEPEADPEPPGQVLVAIDSNSATGNLTGNRQTATFSYNVNNTLEYSSNVTLSMSSTLFEFTSTPSVNVTNDGVTHTYNFSVRKKSGAIFTKSPQYLNIYATTATNSNFLIGRVTISVDVNYVPPDYDPPVISNIRATQSGTLNYAHLTWDSSDASTINNYTVIAYNTSNNEVGRVTTNGDVTSADVSLGSGNVDGTYYFIVYGTDSKGNSGSSYVSSATTSSGYAIKSSNLTVDFYATITYSGSLSNSLQYTPLNQSLSIKFTSTNNNAPSYSNTTVKMGGTTIRRNTDYTTSTRDNTMTIVVNNVTGDLDFSVPNGSCLVEGTKILTINGYKNIEDITYNDILVVWDYDNGNITYEYPIWIEKTMTTNNYQLNTFSDGSTLKTVGYHGVFNKDLNRFVSVDNKDEFNIGSTILKVVNNKLVPIKVTNIENINATVNYYHVVSSRYYNIIANDILTTDGTVMLSNLYGFNNNLKWINKNNKGYDYKEFSDIVPHYMFIGMRMHEAINLPIDINTFKYYLINNQLNENMLKPLNKINNKYIFNVTYGNTNVSVLEGDTITLPKGKWLNTTDNKIYTGTVTIYSSTYFIKLK